MEHFLSVPQTTLSITFDDSTHVPVQYGTVTNQQLYIQCRRRKSWWFSPTRKSYQRIFGKQYTSA